jgi:hypothetical protein
MITTDVIREEKYEESVREDGIGQIKGKCKLKRQEQGSKQDGQQNLANSNYRISQNLFTLYAARLSCMSI